MENQDQILDSGNFEVTNGIDEQKIISTNLFVFLCIVSFGLYPIWWIYKSWRFFQQKDSLDIMPAARAFFSIFFLKPLFDKILDFANEKEYSVSYSTTPLFLGFIFVNLLSKLPDPYWLVSIFSFVFLIPPFKALNFAIQNSDDLNVIEQKSISGRQIILIILGIVLSIVP